MSVNFQAGFDQQRRVPHALSLHTLAGKGIESIFPVFSWSSGYNQCFGSGSAFISPPCRIQHDKIYPFYKIFLLAAIIKITFFKSKLIILFRYFPPQSESGSRWKNQSNPVPCAGAFEVSLLVRLEFDLTFNFTVFFGFGSVICIRIIRIPIPDPGIKGNQTNWDLVPLCTLSIVN